MILEPYDTIALKRFSAQAVKLNDQLEVAFIKGLLSPVYFDAEYPTHNVLEVPPKTEDIEAMVAPKVVKTRQGVKVVFDARASRSITREGTLGFRSVSDYTFAKNEAALVWMWNQPGMTEAFKQVGPLPVKIYANWLANNISRVLMLDGLNAIFLSIIAGYYFMTQMIPEDITESRKFGICGYLARALNVDLELVVRCLKSVDRLNNAIEMIDTMRRVGTEQQFGNYLRLEQLNGYLVYNKLVNGWYGANARDIVGVAIEYVPTFLTMLYTAFNDRTYHSSLFTKMVLEADRRHEGRSIVVTINHLLRGVADV